MMKRMCDILLSALVAGVLYSACGVPAEAQNVTCATRPFGDSSNACASTAFVQNALAPLPQGFANPTASVGLTAVNGTAVTAMRSDAAPPLSQSIAPTMTGIWKFNSNVYFGSGAPWVDVKSGSHSCAVAVGNGSTDDTAAIQCQIDWINTNVGGGTLFFPGGNYLVSTPGIVNKGGTVLQGSGRSITVISATTDSKVISLDAATCNKGMGLADMWVQGYFNAGATQDVVTVGAACPATISRAYIWGGHHGLNTAGVDGTYADVYSCGWTGDNIYSTGANWYFSVKADQCANPSTGNGFEQGATAFAAENYFYRVDFSCGTCTNSIKIDDGGTSRAITYFYGAVTAKPIVISNAKFTGFSGGEFGSATFTGNGLISITGVNGQATVVPSSGTYTCTANTSVYCPLLYNNQTAPSSPASGTVNTYSDSTDLRLHDKNASGVIGTTVVADTGASNNFLTAISAAGAVSKAQPAFSNISGTATAAQGGTGQSTYAVGDLLYASGSTTLSKLAAVATGSLLASAGTSTAPGYCTQCFLSGQLNVGTSTAIIAAAGNPLIVHAGTDQNFAVTTGTSSPYSSGVYFLALNDAVGAYVPVTFAALKVNFSGGGTSFGTTTDPGAGSIQVNAQIFAPNITTSSAAQTGTVCWTTGTGKFTVDTTVGCLSSILGAKNITERLSPAYAMDIVAKLDPFAFRYKKGYGDSGQYEQFGFGAEEVAAVDERMAGRDSNGVLQGVRYQELTAVLAGAIQQLNSRVNKLEVSR